LSDPRDVDIDALQIVELLEGHVESYEVDKRHRHRSGHLSGKRRSSRLAS
jgi:hypothetical protein